MFRKTKHNVEGFCQFGTQLHSSDLHPLAGALQLKGWKAVEHSWQEGLEASTPTLSAAILAQAILAQAILADVALYGRLLFIGDQGVVFCIESMSILRGFSSALQGAVANQGGVVYIYI